MKRTIELQKELELLINQLDKIKSINNTAKENSTNAKDSIKSVTDLISTLSSFKGDLVHDYEKNKQNLETTLDHLDKSILDIKNTFKAEVTKQHNTLQELNKENSEDAAFVQKQLISQVNEFENQLKEATKIVELQFDEFKKNATKKIEDNFGLINEDIKQVSISIKSIEQNISKKLDKNRREVIDVKKMVVAVGAVILVTIIVLKFV